MVDRFHPRHARRPLKQRPFTAFLLLFGTAVAGLAGAVLLVGLLLSAPSRAVIGPPPDILNAAEQVGIRSASGSLLQG